LLLNEEPLEEEEVDDVGDICFCWVVDEVSSPSRLGEDDKNEGNWNDGCEVEEASDTSVVLSSPSSACNWWFISYDVCSAEDVGGCWSRWFRMAPRHTAMTLSSCPSKQTIERTKAVSFLQYAVSFVEGLERSNGQWIFSVDNNRGRCFWMLLGCLQSIVVDCRFFPSSFSKLGMGKSGQGELTCRLYVALALKYQQNHNMSVEELGLLGLPIFLILRKKEFLRVDSVIRANFQVYVS
jgi:hypothetical protein